MKFKPNVSVVTYLKSLHVYLGHSSTVSQIAYRF